MAVELIQPFLCILLQNQRFKAVKKAENSRREVPRGVDYMDPHRPTQAAVAMFVRMRLPVALRHLVVCGFERNRK